MLNRTLRTEPHHVQYINAICTQLQGTCQGRIFYFDPWLVYANLTFLQNTGTRDIVWVPLAMASCYGPSKISIQSLIIGSAQFYESNHIGATRSMKVLWSRHYAAPLRD